MNIQNLMPVGIHKIRAENTHKARQHHQSNIGSLQLRHQLFLELLLAGTGLAVYADAFDTCLAGHLQSASLRLVSEDDADFRLNLPGLDCRHDGLHVGTAPGAKNT